MYNCVDQSNKEHAAIQTIYILDMPCLFGYVTWSKLGLPVLVTLAWFMAGCYSFIDETNYRKGPKRAQIMSFVKF